MLVMRIQEELGLARQAWPSASPERERLDDAVTVFAHFANYVSMFDYLQGKERLPHEVRLVAQQGLGVCRACNLVDIADEVERLAELTNDFFVQLD